MISVGFFIILFNWILEGDFSTKKELFKKNRIGISIMLILLVHIFGLIHTQNFSDGIYDIKIKLPLLLAFVYGTSRILTISKKDILFVLYILSALSSSIFAVLRFFYLNDISGVEDLRNIAFIGDNLQQAYFINLALVLIIYFLFFSDTKLAKYKTVLILAGVWLIAYLFILNSLTGYLILFTLFIYHTILFAKKKKIGKIFAILSVIGFILLSAYTYTVIAGFYDVELVDFSNLERSTVNNNAYQHDTISKRIENSHFIDIYFCEKEMRKEWNKRSTLSYDGFDIRKQQLAETLKRYLSSKNLKKDSVGIVSLSDKDIAFIENGYANYKYTNKFNIEARIHFVLWQFDTYYRTGIADGQSISQRIVFYKVAFFLIKNNFWFGVGSGDVFTESLNYLGNTDLGLSKKYHNRVHNQFVVEFVALGVFGFLAFVFLLFYPYFKNRKWNDYLLTSFYLIIITSFLTDNLFETQLGIAFFSIFYAVFYFRD